ncbi:class I SAM-dependent methyltransferase [Pseudomonas sp. dw_358]|uniref:class I SAM-dependent methyltransferase n=1 Tax=Pseudomonas sp. dw_358 TaxID=2720083 RepID=UPI001BD4CEEC|nr:class I SAM-dependent methyltransferase [Pseudomonas sp. dw_358]
MSEEVKLEFSDKYDEAHARKYFLKHQNGVARRMSHWRDVQLARKVLAMAGDPGLVLDLPCGAGRFWPMLAEKPGRVIIGADNSAAMVQTACTMLPPEVVKRVRPLQTSAFAIDLPEASVDCIFSMRLLHHIGEAAHRAALFKEFHRVTRDSVILSLWVDGNFKAWKRQRAEASRQQEGYQNRFVLPRQRVAREFAEAGFRVERHLDFVPHYAMWRVYLLRKD